MTDFPRSRSGLGPLTLADIGRPRDPQLTARQIAGIASQDLRSKMTRGRLEGTLRQLGNETTQRRRTVEAILATAQARTDERPYAPPPAMRRPPRAANPERLTAAEIALIDRMPEPSKLDDADIGLLLELDARTDGTDRDLVERVLGDAATRMFEKQRAAYVRDVKDRRPEPVGDQKALKGELVSLLAEQLVREESDLAEIHAVDARVAEREARERAQAMIAEAATATVAEWEQRVSAAEAIQIPQSDRSRSMEEARRRAQQERSAGLDHSGSLINGRPGRAGSVEGVRSA